MGHSPAAGPCEPRAESRQAGAIGRRACLTRGCSGRTWFNASKDTAPAPLRR